MKSKRLCVNVFMVMTFVFLFSSVALAGNVLSVFFQPGSEGSWSKKDVDSSFSEIIDVAKKLKNSNGSNFECLKETNSQSVPSPFPHNVQEFQEYIQGVRNDFLGTTPIVIRIYKGQGQASYDQTNGILSAFYSPRENSLTSQILNILDKNYINPANYVGSAQLNIKTPTVEVSKKEIQILAAVAGPTLSSSKINFKAVSNAPNAYADFYRKGVLFYHQRGYSLNGGRGLNIASINPYTGDVQEVRNFDTWFYSAATLEPAIIQFLDSMPEGQIVLMSLADYNNFSQAVINKLQNSFGSQYASFPKQWDSWAMITRKGLAKSYAEQWGRSQETVSIDFSVPLYVKTDKTPPKGTIKINPVPDSSSPNKVVLDLSGITDKDSGLVTMQLSNDEVYWTTIESFKTTYDWYLPRGSGAKTVFGRFTDLMGNLAKIKGTYKLQDPNVTQKSSPVSIFNFETTSDHSGHVYRSYSSGNKTLFEYSSNYGRTWSTKKWATTGKIEKISVDKKGHVYVVYSEQSVLYFNVSSNYGKSWLNKSIIINNSLHPYHRNTRICSTTNGTVYVGWASRTNNGTTIRMNVAKNFGTTWSSPKAIMNVDHLLDYSDEGYLVGCNDQEDVVVAWQSPDAIDYYKDSLYVKTSHDAGVTWSNSDVLLAPPIYVKHMLSMVVDQSKIYIIWANYLGEIFLHKSVDGGRTWLDKTSISKDYYATEYKLLKDSNYLYLFFSSYEGTYFKRSSDEGQSWSNPVMLSPFTYAPIDIDTNDQGLIALIMGTGNSIYLNYSKDFGGTWLNDLPRLSTTFLTPNKEIPLKVITGLDQMIHSYWMQEKLNTYYVFSYYEEHRNP